MNGIPKNDAARMTATDAPSPIGGEGLAAVPGSIFDFESCPKCGGKTGFTYRFTMRGEQFRPWKGGDLEASFEDDWTKHGAYRCADCGKIIKLNVQAMASADTQTP
jgi:DNA-directed RNA polymerase subunit RPC12/RpoP